MPGEFDPTEELGLFPDKVFVCNCRGFVVKNNIPRDLCERFIRNGGHFYDVVSRYDELTAYVLGREEATAGNALKWIVPFLKAYGATDHKVHEYCSSNLEFMPNAGRTIRYISALLPSFITTANYEHCMMDIMDRLNAPLFNVFCSKMDLDHVQFGRAEARKIREMADEISSLRIPKVNYELNVPMAIDDADVRIIKTMDSVLQDRIPELAAMNLMESTAPVTAHKKAYQLLDIRRQTNIDLDSTFYIGGDQTDFQPLDLVRDSGGVAISFNGADFAVRGCNIAVMSHDSTVGAVFAEQFYNKGIQAVMDLAGNWDRKYLKTADFPDRHLIDAMLTANPRKLPEVHIVDRSNVDEIAEKSDKYRRKLLGV